MEHFEKPAAVPLTVNEALTTMNGILGMIQQLGRNDSEIPSEQALLTKVVSGELSPVEGIEAMQAILESKQIH